MAREQFRKVFLVTVPYRDSHYKSGDTPETGLGYIAEAISQAGLEYDILDMTLGYTFEDLKTKIASSNPSLIGFSMKTYRYKENYKLIEEVKKAFPNIPIVVGGPHISVFREKALNECTAVDYGVTREGEETIAELCLGVELSEIKGLFYRNNGVLVYTGDRPVNQNLDKVAFPKFEKFEMSKYWYPSIYLVSSRGCPNQCTFCSIKLAMGTGWRCRSAENVLEEIKYWYARGKRHFEFVDDNFTLWKERAMKICKGIEENNIKAFFNCPNGIRADKVDIELLKMMKKVGWQAVMIGVEVGSDEMLADIKKGEKMADIEKAIQLALEAGLEVHLAFIIGFPRQTVEDVEKEFALALKYPIRWANFNNLLPYIGTELYDESIRNGYLVKPMEEYLNEVSTKIVNKTIPEPILQTPELPLEERRRLLAKANRVQKEIVKRYHIRRLKKMGFGGNIVATLYSNNFIPVGVFNFVLETSKKVKF